MSHRRQHSRHGAPAELVRQRIGAPEGHRTFVILELAADRWRARCSCGSRFDSLAGLDMHHQLVRWGIQ